MKVNTMSIKNRVEVIDIAKGISIILVVFGHSQLREIFPEVNHAMYLFRMPLFLFLSGIFLNVSSRPSAFILGKTDALLKPYFVTLFFIFFTSYMLLDEFSIWRELALMLYGNGSTLPWVPLWFLSHLWILFIITFFLFRYTKLPDRSNIIKTLVVVLLISVSSFFVDTFWMFSIFIHGKEINLPGLPFSLDLIFISMAFFISGSFLSKQVKNFEPKHSISLMVILIFLVISNYTEASMDLNRRVYDEPIFTTIVAIAGIYIILVISYYFSKSKLLTTFFSMFGKASLFVLIFHYPIIHLRPMIDINTYEAVILFFISIFIPLLIRKIILMSKVLKLFYFPLKSN